MSTENIKYVYGSLHVLLEQATCRQKETAVALDLICGREKMRGREREGEEGERERKEEREVRRSLIPCLRHTVDLQALVVQGGVDGSLRPELHRIRRLLKSSEAPRTPGVGRRPQELSPPPEDLLSFAAPSNGLSSSVYVDGEQRAKPLVWRWFLLIRDNNIFICRMQQQAQIILLAICSMLFLFRNLFTLPLPTSKGVDVGDPVFVLHASLLQMKPQPEQGHGR